MNLREVQEWFAAMISQPCLENYLLPELTPNGADTQEEVAKYIAPSSTLQPYQRLQIYHQQFWWRLIKCLQNNFPTLVRLFGYLPFQTQIAIPYLATSLPTHWALCKLGETLPQWLHVNYTQEDRYLVVTAAEIDWAAQEAIWIKKIANAFEKALSKKLILQPFIHLFELRADFFTFRDELLKNEPEYYNTNPFPKMRYGKCHFVLYRHPKNVVSWKEISYAEFWLLLQFKKAKTIEEACSELEEKGGEILEEALLQMPLWFKQWTVLEWFGSSSS
jgi:hypothetical protein